MPLQVAVSGPRERRPEGEANARRVGERLAERGAVVLCGGVDRGVMAAVAAGVAARGGTCVGNIPTPERSWAGARTR